MSIIVTKKREALAEVSYEIRLRWLEYLLEQGSEVNDELILKQGHILIWKSQLSKLFSNLSKQEKALDYEQADKILALLAEIEADVSTS